MTIGEIAVEYLCGEPCDDAISRQAALKLFATNDGKYLYEAIRDLPSVTPTVTEFADKCRECGKQRTGHWIDDCSNLDSCENCKYDDGECCRLLYEAKMESEE